MAATISNHWIFRSFCSALFVFPESMLLSFATFSPSPSFKTIVNYSAAAGVAFIAAVLARSNGHSAAGAEVKARPWLGALLLIAALAPYLITLHSPFLFDSYTQVATVARASFGDWWQSLYTHPAGGDFFFRPIGNAWISLEYLWAGKEPVRWNADGVVLHFIATCLFFILCRCMKVSSGGSLCAALTFEVHGLNPEVVSWMAARYDELAAIFVLSALILFIRYVKGADMLVAAALATVAALLSKEAAFCLPLVAGCCVWYGAEWNRRARQGILLLSAISVVVLGYRWWLVGGVGGYRDSSGHSTALHFNIVKLAELFLFRLWGNLLVPINWSTRLEPWLICLLGAFLCSGSFLLWRSRPSRHRLLASILFTAAAVLPATHLALLDASLLGARVLHLALIGLGMFWAAVYESLSKRQLPLIASANVLFFAAALVHNQQIWRDVARLGQRTCESFGYAAGNESAVAVNDLPRSLKGIFFLSNGFAECVEMNSHKHLNIQDFAPGNEFRWNPKTLAIERDR